MPTDEERKLFAYMARMYHLSNHHDHIKRPKIKDLMDHFEASADDICVMLENLAKCNLLEYTLDGGLVYDVPPIG